MKICIQNLGMYNEGTLLFKWIELPISEEDLKKAYDDIKICHDNIKYYNDCGCPYEEIMIADWEDFGEYPINEYSNIEELNEVVEFLENLSDEEQQIYNHYRYDGYSHEEAKSKLEDSFYIRAENDTDLAYNYIDEIYGGVEKLDRNTLERYFDFEAFGRDLSYDFTQLDDIYLCNN